MIRKKRNHFDAKAATIAKWSYTISTLIPAESAGSFGDGRCCHPSGYLQIDGIRLPADGATSSRLRHAPQATAPVPTGLVALGLPPSPSPKFFRQFHQTNRVNGITRHYVFF